MASDRGIEAILSSILFQVRTAESLEDVATALEVMCTKDDLAVVTQHVEIWKTRKSKQ
ncbi:MAG: hypothetical protein FWE20_01585 [Defluviitaleaceae bacterium]|nr:hypothetical protein [Defluviitaleaceae bacterium]